MRSTMIDPDFRMADLDHGRRSSKPRRIVLDADFAMADLDHLREQPSVQSRWETKITAQASRVNRGAW